MAENNVQYELIKDAPN